MILCLHLCMVSVFYDCMLPWCCMCWHVMCVFVFASGYVLLLSVPRVFYVYICDMCFCVCTCVCFMTACSPGVLCVGICDVCVCVYISVCFMTICTLAFCGSVLAYMPTEGGQNTLSHVILSNTISFTISL